MLNFVFLTRIIGYFSSEKLRKFRDDSQRFLKAQIEAVFGPESGDEAAMEVAENRENCFGIEPFFIAKGLAGTNQGVENFTFTAPTTASNTVKLLRSLQLRKPLLLEGSPGVGKTSLVSALAKSSGHKLLRINLSEQTVSGNAGNWQKSRTFVLNACFNQYYRTCRTSSELIYPSRVVKAVNSHGETDPSSRR